MRVKAVKKSAKASAEASGGAPSDEQAEVPAQDTIFAEYVDNDFVMVYRRDEVKKQYAYEYRMAPDECREDVIQERSGGGDYKLVLRGPSADGRAGNVIKTQRVVLIKGPRKMYTPAAEPAPASAPPASAAPGGVGDMQLLEMHRAAVAQMYQNMADQQKLFAAMMLRVLQAGDQKPATSLGEIAQLISAVKGETKREENPLDLALRIAEAMRVPTPPTPIQSGISQLKELLEVRDLLGGDREASDPMTEAIRQFGPVIAGAMQTAKRADAAPARRALPPAGGDVIQQLGPMVPVLLEQASNGVDTEAYAQALAEKVPEPARRMITAALQAPTIIDRIVKAYPALGNYRPWLESFRAAWLILHGVEAVPAQAAPTPPSPPLPGRKL